MSKSRAHTSFVVARATPILLASLILALGACQEMPLRDGWYSCDPALSGACPTGLSCVWSAEAGEYRCLSTDPSPDAGTDGGGEVCGPGTCAGCCDRFGLCRNGAEDPRCGVGGQDCVDCSAQNRTCVGGVCQGSTCDCTTGTCCDGCYFRPATVVCDPTVVATELGCSGTDCGSDAQQREQQRYCTGTSADCTDANLHWGAWVTAESCQSNQICQQDASGARCVTCQQGCAGGQCLSVECGDGDLDPGEQCDDGNTQAGDGCGPTCLHEECGNGYLDPGEQCDDGNTQAGDGCSATCQNEAPETNCSDGVDNDGDGAIDCLDGDCSGQTCGLNGLLCIGTSCACPGGTTETNCGDTSDNDCDGNADCNDADCNSDPLCAQTCTNPLDPASDCGSNHHCVPTNTMGADGQCDAPTGSGTQNSVCSVRDDCGDIYECTDTSISQVCLQWCVNDTDCSVSETCYSTSPASYIGSTEWGLCWDGFT